MSEDNEDEDLIAITNKYFTGEEENEKGFQDMLSDFSQNDLSIVSGLNVTENLINENFQNPLQDSSGSEENETGKEEVFESPIKDLAPNEIEEEKEEVKYSFKDAMKKFQGGKQEQPEPPRKPNEKSAAAPSVRGSSIKDRIAMFNKPKEEVQTKSKEDKQKEEEVPVKKEDDGFEPMDVGFGGMSFMKGGMGLDLMGSFLEESNLDDTNNDYSQYSQLGISMMNKSEMMSHATGQSKTSDSEINAMLAKYSAPQRTAETKKAKVERQQPQLNTKTYTASLTSDFDDLLRNTVGKYMNTESIEKERQEQLEKLKREEEEAKEKKNIEAGLSEKEDGTAKKESEPEKKKDANQSILAFNYTPANPLLASDLIDQVGAFLMIDSPRNKGDPNKFAKFSHLTVPSSSRTTSSKTDPHLPYLSRIPNAKKYLPSSRKTIDPEVSFELKMTQENCLRSSNVRSESENSEELLKLAVFHEDIEKKMSKIEIFARDSLEKAQGNQQEPPASPKKSSAPMKEANKEVGSIIASQTNQGSAEWLKSWEAIEEKSRNLIQREEKGPECSSQWLLLLKRYLYLGSIKKTFVLQSQQNNSPDFEIKVTNEKQPLILFKEREFPWKRTRVAESDLEEEVDEDLKRPRDSALEGTPDEEMKKTTAEASKETPSGPRGVNPADLKRKFFACFTDFKLSLPHGHEARKLEAQTLWGVCLSKKIPPKNWRAFFAKVAADAASK